MVSIEHLKHNGTERIAHQHVIDGVLQRDRERRKESRQSKWWKDLTGESSDNNDPAIETLHSELPVTDIVVFTEPSAFEEDHTSDYLGNFITSDAYKELHSQLFDYIEVAQSGTDVDAIFREFAGAAFETIVYEYFEDEQKDHAIVLGPQETDAYFQRRFGDRKVIRHPFGKIGLEGIVVPDSLVIEDGKVIKQAEFSLHGKEDYFHHKYEGFLRNKYAKSLSDAYGDRTKLVYGVPANFSTDLQQRLEECYGNDIDFYQVPFTRGQFYREVLSPLSYLWQIDK